MVAIKEIEQRLLTLPLKQRVYLAESLLASVPVVGEETTEADDMTEVERREKEIDAGKVHAMTDAEFWRAVEADLK
jgi:Putative addiction module component